MPENSIRLLLVEDDYVDQMAFKRLVKKEQLPYDFQIAGSISEARQILASPARFDVILLDFDLGDGTSFELMDTLNALEAPIIFATGTGDETVAVKAMKAGAADYLIKDPERNYLQVLPATVENAIERKKATRQIRMLSHAVMSASDSIYITDMADRILFVNKAFCQTYGYTPDDVLNQAATILQPENGAERLPDNQTKNGSEALETYHRRKDGGNFPVSLSRSVIEDENGDNLAIVAVARDITERKRVEQELRELNASKDKFFSIISHDLRSPFATLMGYSELMQREIDTLSRDEVKEFADTIHQTARRLSDLLDNLLQWARIQESRLEFAPDEINLSELVQTNVDLLQLSAKNKNISLMANLQDKVYVQIDKNMISSVTQNLISNSLKFTHPGGQVAVRLEQRQDDVLVSVSDSGVGMGPEVLAKLFRIDTHHTTPGTAQEKGSGLGLILCKEFVEKNGGQIWVDSQPGQGTTFAFTLPRL